MEPIVPPAIEAYAARHSSPESPLLRELADYTRAHRADAQMLTGALEGALLKLLVTLCGARSVLEIGLFTGYSALTMAEALPAGGRLVSLDVDPGNAAIARDFIARSPHRDKIEIRLGPALDTLRAWQPPPVLDFVFLDADKENYAEYYDIVLPWLRPGALLVADNTLWSGRVLAPQKDSDRAIVAFNDKVARDPRVNAVLLTVRDGVTVIRKKGG